MEPVLIIPVNCRSKILCHINCSTIGPKKQLLIQSIRSQISPYWRVFIAVKNILFKRFLDYFLSMLISLWFIVYFIEIHTKLFISFIKPGINPRIHSLPELNDLCITCFPFKQHFPCFLHHRGRVPGLILINTASHKVFNLGFILLFKENIVFPNKMITFYPCSFRSFSITKFLPGQHWLTDMNSPVVDNICFYYIMSADWQNPVQWKSKEIVADMSKM